MCLDAIAKAKCSYPISDVAGYQDVTISAFLHNLLSTLSQKYPIGAIDVSLRRAACLQNPHLFEGVGIILRPHPKTLVLDGQQRLTYVSGALWWRKPVNTRAQAESINVYFLDMAVILHGPGRDRRDARSSHSVPC
jgi:hypothetical protein